MSLDLDDRQRAMLAEMGVRVFEPLAREAATAPVLQAPAAPPAVVARPMKVSAPPSTSRGIELMEWDTLAEAVAGCRACQLCAGRRNTVFGAGDRQADWLIVGEAPSVEEDQQGEPFAGDAGKLLDNMLRALGLDRHHNVYLTNVVKCRPAGGRNPQRDELAQCEHFLRRQVQLLQPKIILAMGPFATQTLLGTDEAIGKLRGRQHEYHGVPVVVTFHLPYFLRSPAEKTKAWADLCFAQEIVRAQG